MLKPMCCVATRGHIGMGGSCNHLRSCWFPWHKWLCLCPWFQWCCGVMLMSVVACVTIKGHVDVPYATTWSHVNICGLCCHVEPCWFLCSVVCVAAWGHGDVHRLGRCWGPYRCPQPTLNWRPCWCSWPVLLVARASADSLVYVHGLYCHQRQSGSPWHVMMLETMELLMVCAVARNLVEVHDSCS